MVTLGLRLRVSSLIVAGLLLGIGPVQSQSAQPAGPDAACLACHSQKDLQSSSGHSLYIDAAKHQKSVHADLPCMSCHTDIHDFPHPAHVARVSCGSCHADEAADFAKSAHAALGEAGCTACHGSAHYAAAPNSIAPSTCPWLTGRAAGEHLKRSRPTYYKALTRKIRASITAASDDESSTGNGAGPQ